MNNFKEKLSKPELQELLHRAIDSLNDPQMPGSNEDKTGLIKFISEFEKAILSSNSNIYIPAGEILALLLLEYHSFTKRKNLNKVKNISETKETNQIFQKILNNLPKLQS